MIRRRLKKLEDKIKELEFRLKINKIYIDTYRWLFSPIVVFENTSPNPDPSYANEGDSGFDLRAWLKEGEHDVKYDENGFSYIEILPHERRLIHTGIRIELPEHTEAQVRPRSGLALKFGQSLANAIGTIDEGFRGEIGIIALNTSNETIIVKNGDRIAQCVICPVFNSNNITLVKIDKVDRNTERGEGGFGHSGQE